MPARKIRVVSTSVIKTGTSSNGRDWTLYEVVAVDENGAPIEEKLRSFEDLQGEVEVEIERKDDAKYGTSFTLKKAGGGGGNPGSRLGPKVDELRGRVDHLDDQVRNLQQAFEDIKLLMRNAGQAPAQDPEAEPAGSRFGGDDDIPFAWEGPQEYVGVKTHAARW